MVTATPIVEEGTPVPISTSEPGSEVPIPIMLELSTSKGNCDKPLFPIFMGDEKDKDRVSCGLPTATVGNVSSDIQSARVTVEAEGGQCPEIFFLDSPEGYDEIAGLMALEGGAWSSPAFANGHIYARGLKQITRVDIRSASVASAPEREAASGVGTSKLATLIDAVRSAKDKKAVVDRFMASSKPFPIVDGNDLVHFVYRGTGEDLALASDLFGARQERPMRRIEGTDFFHYSTRLDDDARINYLFIRDAAQTARPTPERFNRVGTNHPLMRVNFHSGINRSVSIVWPVFA